jgi:hypothetical protein
MAIANRTATPRQAPQNLVKDAGLGQPNSQQAPGPLTQSRIAATKLPVRVAATTIQTGAASLSQKVDDLLVLRDLLKQSNAAERAMTAEILDTLQAAGIESFEGQQGVAIVGERENLIVDPQLFLEHTGPKGLVAVTVSVTRAREFIGEDDLRGIAEATQTPVLRVVPRKVA